MMNVGGGSNAAHDRDDGTTDTGTGPPGPPDRRPDEPELQRLLPAAAGGDRRALEEFLRELQPHVVRFCRSRLGGQPGHAADEVAQDVLVAVCEALPRFQPTGAAVLAFVFGIAKHKIADSYRSAKRNRSIPSESVPDSIDPGIGPEGAAVRTMESARVREAMAQLPEHYREILVLRLALGWSGAETAAHIGSTPGAVRVTQHRAMTRLREILAATDVEIEGTG